MIGARKPDADVFEIVLRRVLTLRRDAERVRFESSCFSTTSELLFDGRVLYLVMTVHSFCFESFSVPASFVAFAGFGAFVAFISVVIYFDDCVFVSFCFVWLAYSRVSLEAVELNVQLCSTASSACPRASRDCDTRLCASRLCPFSVSASVHRIHHLRPYAAP